MSSRSFNAQNRRCLTHIGFNQRSKKCNLSKWSIPPLINILNLHFPFNSYQYFRVNVLYIKRFFLAYGPDAWMCLAYFYYSNKAIFQCNCCVLSSCTSLAVTTVFNYTIIYKYIQNLHENTQNKTLTLRHGAGRMYVIQLYFRKQLAGLASIQEARLRSVIFTDKGERKISSVAKIIWKQSSQRWTTMSWRRIITGKTRKRPSRTSGSCWFARNGEFRASLRRCFTLTRFQSDIMRLLRHVRAMLSHLLSQSCREVNITPWLMCYVSFTLLSFVLIAKTTHLIPRNVVWTLWLGVNNNSNISASEDALVLFSFLHVLFPLPARVWWMNPCVWERASISCAGEAARSSQ